MAESMFSSSWYRVEGLKPKLRSHIQVTRHHYRGKLWYVLQDRSSGQNHRFSPEVHYVLSLMDGKRNFQEIWDLALEKLGDDAPTQDEMVRLFGQLHTHDLLLCDVPPDTMELFQRFERKQRGKWKQRLFSPLSIRLPIWDPDNFLERWLFLVRPLYGLGGQLLWVATITFAIFLAASNWPDLTGDVADRIMAPSNLLVLFFVYPAVKFLHELGHAFSTKVWGGEVHEMGIMLLVFMPIPYVDASSAWAFRERKKRVVVGAAGMAVELFLAALALFVWVNAEQGVVRTIAYNVMLIGGVSTLFFNGNPLLRFDGYYIFSDLIEIPNLSSRSNNYIGYLIQRYLFAVKHLNSPAADAGERIWLVGYGVASFIYRMMISFVIVLFVAGKFFVIGVIIALWALMTMIFLPLWKAVRFLFVSPAIQRQRARAVTISFAAVVTVVSVLFFLPMPLSTYTEGVVWLPEKAKVRINTEGFVKSIAARSNDFVHQGDVLLEMEDPLLKSKHKVLRHRIDELKTQYRKAWNEDQVQAQILEQQIEALGVELALVEEELEGLVLRSAIDGVLIIPEEKDLEGNFLQKGTLIAYVVNYPLTTVRTVVRQDDIGLVRERIQSAQVRFVDNIKRLYTASVYREVPAASDKLPSQALGFSGGGRIPIDPSEGNGMKAFEPVFQIDLKFPSEAHVKNIGERVYVRFDLGEEPLAWQWLRLGRQLFLRRFSV